MFDVHLIKFTPLLLLVFYSFLVDAEIKNHFINSLYDEKIGRRVVKSEIIYLGYNHFRGVEFI